MLLIYDVYLQNCQVCSSFDHHSQIWAIFVYQTLTKHALSQELPMALFLERFMKEYTRNTVLFKLNHRTLGINSGFVVLAWK